MQVTAGLRLEGQGRGRLCAEGTECTEVLHVRRTKGAAAGMGSKMMPSVLYAGALLFHCMRPVKAPAELSCPHTLPHACAHVFSQSTLSRFRIHCVLRTPHMCAP